MAYSLNRTLLFTDPGWLILGLGALVTAFFPVQLPGMVGKTAPIRVTASNIFLFAALLLFSPEAAVAVAVIERLVLNARKRLLYRVVYDLSLVSLATFTAGHLFYHLQKTTPPLQPEAIKDLAPFILHLTAAALTYLLLYTLFLSLTLSLSSRASWMALWSRSLFWVIVANVGAAATAAVGLFLHFEGAELLALCSAVPVILVIRYAYRANQLRIRALTDSRQLLQDTLDSLSSQVAILDNKGGIIAVNRVWAEGSPGHPLTGDACPVGSNYLTSCQRARNGFSSIAKELNESVASVINRPGEISELEYEWEHADQQFWFKVSVRPFQGSGPLQVVVAHEDITHLKLAEARAANLASYDALTGLPNRDLLSKRLREEIDWARRKGHRLAVLSVDLDDFKIVIDTLGYEAGDTLLRFVSRRLRGCLRGYDYLARTDLDAPLGDDEEGDESQGVVGRLGGDEFVIVLRDIADPKEAATVAVRIAGVLAKPFEVLDQEIFLTASIGICVYPDGGSTVAELLKHSDAAMHDGKALGKNTYRFFTPKIDEAGKERLTLATSLRRAVERDELVLYYQPKIEIGSGRVVGAEALLRWRHPTLGLIPPGKFIPLSEETGLILPIGKWALEAACEQAKRWQQLGLSDFSVAVNVSGRQLQDGNLVPLVSKILEKSGLDPTHLELEITEGVLMSDSEASKKALAGLKNLHVNIALDDFGTGYSSMGYLQRFPIDVLKIDRSFVKNLAQKEEDRSIASAIIALSQTLHLGVVAEGVEEQSQLSFLHSQHCHQAQGFLFSAPLPAEEFEEWMRNWEEKKRELEEQPEKIVVARF
jgi:predicted signal transduction protein with EAL and GGDEF domain